MISLKGDPYNYSEMFERENINNIQAHWFICTSIYFTDIYIIDLSSKYFQPNKMTKQNDHLLYT